HCVAEIGEEGVHNSGVGGQGSGVKDVPRRVPRARTLSSPLTPDPRPLTPIHISTPPSGRPAPPDARVRSAPTPSCPAAPPSRTRRRADRGATPGTTAARAIG